MIPEELVLRIKDGLRLQQLTSHEHLIIAMSKLAEYRSPETGFHIERVAGYCRVLGLKLAEDYPNLITRTQVEEIANLSVLHDIGKVTVPDHILHKPGVSQRKNLKLLNHIQQMAEK